VLKIAFLTFFLLTLLNAENVNKKIKNTKKILSKNSKKEREIKKSLTELSQKIAEYERSLNRIKKAIKNLEADIATYKSKSKISQKKLNKIKNIYNTLKNSQNEVNKKLVSLLSKDIHLSILLENGSSTNSQEQLVESYINEIYSTILRDKFNKTKVKFFKLKLDIALVKSELNKLNGKIKSLEEKKAELKNLNIAKRDGIHKLLVLKKSYTKKLTQVRKENRELTALLRKLNILKEEKIKKENEQKETIVLKPSNDGNVNVRRVGNSYNRTPVIKYRGPKTIAPFKRYKVVRKFGNFTDPTYKIKMFNPNVILKPIGSKNVINVLDGKVISITRTPAIGNIIIVENKNGIHTLYAKVNQIAPTIKEGRYIKKGYILGKVKDELYFEVTKNNSNINPLRLIR
jgi:murein DD-endopeptidase MepM/ murein hydrolase activator NlpD